MLYGTLLKRGSLNFLIISQMMIVSVSGLKVMEGAYAIAASVQNTCIFHDHCVFGKKATNIACSHYGPGIFDFFLQQNRKVSDGTSKEKYAHYIHLDTLGIVNGLIDLVVQGESLITYPYNNVSRSVLLKSLTIADLAASSEQSYGIQVFNQSLHDELLHNWTRPHGCRAQIQACQDSLEQRGMVFIDQTTQDFDEICGNMDPECKFTRPFDVYQNEVEPGAGWYDVTAPKADPFPPPYMHGFLTQESVLAALGVPVNFVSQNYADPT